MARVTLDEIDVMCVLAQGGPEGGAAAFAALEGSLGSLRGRRFYGTYLTGEYRACVAIAPGDDAAALGLQTWRIPGGDYEHRRLLEWPDHVAEIPSTFAAMAAGSRHDASRPSIEYYRSAKEVVLLQPVLG